MKIWKIFSLFILQNMKKFVSEENTEAMAEQPSGRVMDSVGHLNRNRAERWDYTAETASLK